MSSKKRSLDEDADTHVKVESEVKKQKSISPSSFKYPGAQILFLVGGDPSPSAIMVHKEFACHASPVFEAAFNDYSCTKDQTETYEMPDTTVRAFRLLMQWIYQRKLILPKLQVNDGEADPDKMAILNDEMALIEVWVLAERLLMPHLQNAALDAIDSIHQATNKAISGYSYLYKNTAKTSQLRRFFATKIATQIVLDRWVEQSQDFPWDLLHDIATMALTGWRREEPVPKLVVSDYYVPVDDQ